MEKDLMNISYNLVNGETIAWSINNDEESSGAFYMNDRRQLCVEGNGKTIEEVKRKIVLLVSRLGEDCDILLNDMDVWVSFESLKAKQTLYR